jgi:hypothetical protein
VCADFTSDYVKLHLPDRDPPTTPAGVVDATSLVWPPTSLLFFFVFWFFILFPSFSSFFFMCQAKVANLYMWSYFIGLTFSCAYMSQVPLRTLITRGVNPVRFPNFLAKTGNRNRGTPVPCFGKLEPEPGPGPR